MPATAVFRLIALAACVTLAACASGGGPSVRASAYMGDPATANLGTDQFYDGGIFDQDLLAQEPGRLIPR